MSEEKKIPEEELTIGNKQLAKDPAADQTQPQTSNIEPQTTDMEVPHRSHAHGKKNWKTYLFEFFMLSLAVFCGFLAEYQLEHTIEHQREKEFAQALYDEFLADSISAANKLNARLEKEKDCDYLYRYIKD